MKFHRHFSRALGQLVTASATLMLLGLAACEPDQRFELSLGIGAGVALDKGLAIHETGYDRVLYLSGSLDKPKVKELLRAGENEQTIWLRAGHPKASSPELFVMTAPVDPRKSDRGEQLVRIEPVSGKTTRYSMGATYDALAFDAEGEHALFYFGASTSQNGGFYNPNEVAILKLADPPSATNPTVTSVQMNGRRIAGVTFLPPLTVDGTVRKLAVFFAEGAIRLVDLFKPEDAVTVPLVAKSDTRQVLPVQALARTESETAKATVFVRANGSEEIYAIALGPAAEGASGFGTAMNLLDVGGAPADMVLGADAASLVVLTSTGGKASLTIANPATSSAFSVAVGDSAQKLLVRQAADGPELVIYGDGARGVHFASLAALEGSKGASLTHLNIPEGVLRTVLLSADRLLLLPNGTVDVVLLDLATRRPSRLSIGASMSESVNWDAAKAQGERFFFLAPGGDSVNVVDLATSHPESLFLDEPATALFLLPGAGLGVGLSGAGTGSAVLFPLKDPSRSKAVVVKDIFLEGCLDETEVR